MATPRENEAAKALIETAMRLRASAPEAWGEFTRAVDTQAAVANERMLTAHGTDLIRLQGHAQALRTHADFLRDVRAHAEALNRPQAQKKVNIA